MLEFNIRNQTINRVDRFSPAEKSIDYLFAKFEFKTEDWKDAVKTVVFRNDKTGLVYECILTSEKCLVPWEVLQDSGMCSVSVRGDIGTKVITTDTSTFKLNFTLSGGESSKEPTPDVYSQLLQELSNRANNLEYKDNVLRLMSGDKELARVTITGGSGGEGGSPLPEITEKDNGKVLMADGGAWIAKELPVFDGVYEINPSANNAILMRTGQKYMDADVIVNKIPYSEVTNPSNGKTITIG